ncbi:putative membrane protein [Campylobacter blaseri]|uniref:Uncharacterized protein n=1 Tax=Campylobacter blaseri TaxID=2042961 RepID=A0A2P8R2J3_9BACT|nr:hypothetical protein [Campylobacter blaseri]PSM52717.1 hypothetical protein CQ405_03025 [Campylobacter blaseri]PSM54365.1 hypothetical protein CRN67_03025 [Campylobacter blaseri]QKF86021.1 putative membrane protein [Campylobacter blaseri]
MKKILVFIFIYFSFFSSFAFSLTICDNNDVYCQNNINSSGVKKNLTLKTCEYDNRFLCFIDSVNPNNAYIALNNPQSGGYYHNDGSEIPATSEYYLFYNTYQNKLISVSYFGTDVTSCYYPPSVPCASLNHFEIFKKISCKSNEFFNSKTNSCDSCDKGQVYDLKFNKCVDIKCKEDEIYDSETDKCIKKDKCKEDEIYNSQTKECIKRPWWCPVPMIYQEKDPGFLKAMIKICVPDPNINEEECQNKGMNWHSWADLYGAELGVAMRYPQGCYHSKTVERFKAENQLENDSFFWSGVLFPIPIGALKNGWNSLAQAFNNFFKGKNIPKANQSLLEYKPIMTDIEITPQGPMPKIDFKPIEPKDIIHNSFNKGDLPPSSPKSKPSESFDSYLDRYKNFNGSRFEKSPQDFVHFNPKFEKMDLPHNAATFHLKDNSFVASKIKQEFTPMPIKDTFKVNSPVETKVKFDFSTILEKPKNPKNPNLPMTIRKVSENGNKSNYKGIITTPDNSIIDVSVVETKTPSGGKIQDVTLTYPYIGPNKSNLKFNTGYTITIDKSGAVTNTISNNSTIYNPTTNTTTVNNISNTVVPNASPDLSSVVNAINKVGSKVDTTNKILNDIKAQQKAEWEYNPGINIATATSKLNTEMSKFDGSVDDILNFLNGLKDNINDAKNQVDSAVDLIQNGIDSPNIPRGTCPFNISGPAPGSGTKNTFTIDPCRFVAPYKPILTLFFTAILSWGVLIFSLKFLFNVGDK